MQGLKPEISVVVPVYNSAVGLPELVSETNKALSLLNVEYEMVFVVDGSPDNSEAVLRQLASKDQRVKVVALAKNFGQISATMAGIRLSRGNRIIIMDDDLQNPPSEIPKILQELDRGRDFVVAIPRMRMSSASRKFFTLVNDWMARVCFGKPMDFKLSSFMGIDGRMRDVISQYSGPFPYLAGILFRISRNCSNVQVEHSTRKHGQSQYSFRKMLRLWMHGVTLFSISPLRLVGYLGGLTAVLSLLILLTIAAAKVANFDFSAGWPSIICLVSFFSGVNLISLSIIGEYIGRTYLHLNRQPQYVVKSVVNMPNLESRNFFDPHLG